MKEAKLKAYSTGEEIASSVIHGVGALLAVAGLVAMLVVSITSGSTLSIISISIYGSSMILLYTASTMYHAIQNKKAKYIFKAIDHSSIYLLIAGTYTPFTLVVLGGLWGWVMLIVVWAIALAGILLEVLGRQRSRTVSLLIYLGMSWLVVIVIKPLLAGLAWPGLLWLVAGGLLYSAGVVFYVQKKTSYMHAVWHLFVLAGSACHFITVLVYVL